MTSIRTLATPQSGRHWFRMVPVTVLLGVSHLKVVPTQLSNEIETESIEESKWLRNMSFDDLCTMMYA